MKFAFFNGKKVEPIKGCIGICPVCKAELVAKCGELKMHHWAHKGIRNCDSWWEPENEWHRSWKNNFPEEWQEVFLTDEGTGEKHIADVRTSHGLVIEFQHSHINSEERNSRENFYQNMIWVVDGTRLKGDYPRFVKGTTNFRRTNNPGIFHVDMQDECFPSAWISNSAPVIFDFRGTETTDDSKDFRNHLYCLMPNKDCRYAILAKLSRRDFIDSTISDEWLLMIQGYLERPNQNQYLQDHGIQHFSVRRQSPYIFVKGRFIKRRRF